MKSFTKYLSVACATIILLTACTLRFGGANKLPDEAAPTAVPLPASASAASLPPGLTPPDKPIQLPEGFAINVFARDLSDPRMMALGPDGAIYVAERGADRVIRLPDRDGDGQSDGVELVAADLRRPNSLAFHPDGSLYVGETRQVLRLSAPDAQGAFQERKVVIEDLPASGHNTRTVLFSPDGKSLFVSVGSSCNVCEEEDARRAAIVRYNPDGSGEELYASGLRNAVGIVFRPDSDELWASNNGRDMLGDDLPPETVYQVEEGADYGWPRCHSGRIADPEFGGPDACQGVSPPTVEMQAHSAPLGLRFYDGRPVP